MDKEFGMVKEEVCSLCVSSHQSLRTTLLADIRGGPAAARGGGQDSDLGGGGLTEHQLMGSKQMKLIVAKLDDNDQPVQFKVPQTVIFQYSFQQSTIILYVLKLYYVEVTLYVIVFKCELYINLF